MSTRAQRRELDRLYAKIPAWSCGQTGCSDCCGPVPAADVEIERAPKLASITTRLALTGCFSCPYSEAGGCAIYEDRPFMCRLFGVADHPRLLCPHGHRPEKLLSAAQADALTRDYIAIVGDRSVAA